VEVPVSLCVGRATGRPIFLVVVAPEETIIDAEAATAASQRGYPHSSSTPDRRCQALKQQKSRVGAVLSHDEMERFRRRILQERSAVESRIQARTDDLESGGEQRADELGDDAQLIAAREQAIDDNARDRDLLGRIDGALARIESATYGVSEVSGEPIPIERLEALPWATTLVDEEPPTE
jgi:DnaK suppressor protein